MIEAGEVTLEKRVLVRLPDFRQMQVVAKIDEDKIAVVRPGLPVTLTLEAFPGVVLHGKVRKINEYPEAEEWFGSAVKQYKTIVAIEAPPPGTRPGMTADLKIHLNRLENRLQVPCPAVIRHGDQNYCIAETGDRLEARPVTLGPSNGMNVVIREGLREGDEVVLAAAAHRDKIQLPELKRPPSSARSLTASLQPASPEGIHN
jgi:multidrug efflux pump subunit AcrA (membrane-fusion protein)